MNNYLAHILIFQLNEYLKKNVPCYFNENLGFTKSKGESLEEHLLSLSTANATEFLRDYGYPLNPSEDEVRLAKWFSLHLLTVYLRTPEKTNDNVYTSLHCVNCGVVSQQISNPLNLNCFKTYFMETLLGSSLPLNLRKALLVTALTSGSQSLTALGGFHNGKE